MRTFTIIAILCACLALTFALELELFSDENCNSGKTITINVGFNDCHGIADKGFELTSYGTGNNTAWYVPTFHLILSINVSAAARTTALIARTPPPASVTPSLLASATPEAASPTSSPTLLLPPPSPSSPSSPPSPPSCCKCNHLFI